MAHRVGAGLLATGFLAFGAGVIMTGGAVIRPDFNGWRVVFQAGILATSLGVTTIVLEPASTFEGIGATILGVAGQISISLLLVVGFANDLDAVRTLLWTVLPLAPMALGYMAGVLRSVPELSIHRRRTISKIGAFTGLIIWFGAYQLFLMRHDTTGELGYNPGFLFLGYSLLLIGDLVGGGILYAVWRLRDPSSTSK